MSDVIQASVKDAIPTNDKRVSCNGGGGPLGDGMVRVGIVEHSSSELQIGTSALYSAWQVVALLSGAVEIDGHTEVNPE